ncbi:transglutaminase family protein [Streptomyces sp. NPDC002073]
MSGRARLTLFALLATLLTSCSMVPLVHPDSWLLRAMILVSVQSGVGALARRVPLARVLTVAAQLLVSLVLLTLSYAGERALAGVLPGPGVLRELAALYGQGVEDVGHYATPAPLTDGIGLLLVSGVLVVGLCVDLLAVTLRSAAPAGLPLLALYSVAAGLSPGGAAWGYFVLAAAGYLLLLLAESRERLSRWGRVFGGPAGGRSNAGLSAGGALAPVRTGRRLGMAALGVAVAVPLALPALDGGLLAGRGVGDGEGSGGGTISAVNPLVSLQSNLNQPENREVLRYRTDNPDAPNQYLRIVALDEFDGTSWRTSEREITDVPDLLPPPPGLSPQVKTTEVRTSLSAAGWYGQTYLPLPYPATQVEIGGRWRFEPVGRTLVGDRKQDTRGARYTVRSLQVQPTAKQLAAAPPAPEAIRAEYTDLPETLPAVVRQTARSVTRGATSDYARAVALQDWFASSGGFTYDTSGTSGTGSEAIVRFLKAKRGFCVHFSFSMAAMARELGIPARVAVGFTPGTAQSDGTRSVGLRDAHAWPELYFEGVGWTRFEPTPTRGSTPDYTVREATPSRTTGPSAEVPTGQQSGAAPAPSASGGCTQQMRRLGDCGPTAGAGAGPTDGGAAWWSRVLVALAVAAPVALLLLLPFLWRLTVRRRRLTAAAGPAPSAPTVDGVRSGRAGGPAVGGGPTLAVWQELTDAAWDVGILPDDALSPRRTAERIVRDGRLDPEPAAAVHRVAGAVEQVLYAPVAPPVAGLSADVLLVRAALLAEVDRWTRLRARLAPRSSVRAVWALSDRWAALTAAVSARGRALRLRIPLRGRG